MVGVIHIHVDYSGDGTATSWAAAVFQGEQPFPSFLLGGALPLHSGEEQALLAAITKLQVLTPSLKEAVLYTDDLNLAERPPKLPQGLTLRHISRKHPRHTFAHDAAQIYRRKQLELRGNNIPKQNTLRCTITEMNGHLYAELTCGRRVTRVRASSGKLSSRLQNAINSVMYGQGKYRESLVSDVIQFVQNKVKGKAKDFVV